MNFKNLHQKKIPLLICNVWDVASAKKAEQLNFDAIGTSSGAIADMLGYKDGEEISFAELEYIVKRITANSQLPLSVNLEAGYSRNPNEISNHIKRLVDLGVVGVNIEDSIVTKKRRLVDAEGFAKTLSTITENLKKENVNVFINIRTDTFLLSHSTPIEETIKRIHLYENAGANGIFIPCIEKEEDISKITSKSNMPINVMCMPNLPPFYTLQKLGVKRISMGNFLFNHMYKNFENALQSILSTDSFKPIFS